jgi:hypothetical protein
MCVVADAGAAVESAASGVRAGLMARTERVQELTAAPALARPIRRSL